MKSSRKCGGVMKPVGKYQVGRGRTRVRLYVFRGGRDIAAFLDGRGRHLGAAAVAYPAGKRGVRVRTIGVPGHCEAGLVRDLARSLCLRWQRVCLVAGGIHVDRIAPAEIEVIQKNVRRIRTQIEGAQS